MEQSVERADVHPLSEALPPHAPFRDCKYLSIGGGGVYGFSYIGVMRALERERGRPFHVDVQGCAGTSVGAMIAAGVVLGGDFERLDSLMRRKSWDGFAMSTMGLFESRGLSDHSFLRAMLTHLVESLGFSSALTMADTHRITKKELHVCATDLAHDRQVIFHHKSHPNVLLIDAVIASCCIPILFEPKKIDDMVLVDGYLCENLMLRQFPLHETFVLRMERKTNLGTLKDYLRGVITCSSVISEERQLQQLNDNDRQRIVTVPEHKYINGSDLGALNVHMVATLISHGYTFALRTLHPMLFVHVGTIVRLTIQLQRPLPD
jgi:hypothetical protein